MNLPVSAPNSAADSRPVISTYSILLLSGMLFGICVSGSVPSDTRNWVITAGTLGLLAYVATSVTAHKQKQEQQRLAAIQVEQRLDRHSHFDLRADAMRIDQPNAATPA